MLKEEVKVPVLAADMVIVSLQANYWKMIGNVTCSVDIGYNKINCIFIYLHLFNDKNTYTEKNQWNQNLVPWEVSEIHKRLVRPINKKRKIGNIRMTEEVSLKILPMFKGQQGVLWL